MKTQALTIATGGDKDVRDITIEVESRLGGMKDGLCVLFIRHTTAALTTGEYSEGTGEDLLLEFNGPRSREVLLQVWEGK